jgi:maleylacetate reductase
MQQGQIAFTMMDRVLFGKPAAQAIAEEAERLGAKRVFLLVGGTLNRETDEIRKVEALLGERFCGLHDSMPAHSPRHAVVACANAARAAGTDLLVTFGGGSVTDGGKAVTICLKHGVTDEDGLEPFRTVVGETGKRIFPVYDAPDVRQIAVPTTLSGGEFNARAGVTDSRVKLKQAYVHRGIVPVSVILDGSVTRHTPEWLFLSTGIRAVDHAVETYLSLDANDYWDGAAPGEGRPKRYGGAAEVPDRRLALDDRHRFWHPARRQPCDRPYPWWQRRRAARIYVMRDAALCPGLERAGERRPPKGSGRRAGPTR